MPRLTIATIATDTPMGAQVYQEEVASRAATALRATGDAWSFRRLVVRSMRARMAGNRRLPLGMVATAPPRVRRELGRLIYAGDTVSHRMNLELPPSPHGDVVTIHDVVAWTFPDESPPVPAAAEEARNAAAVICVSQYTAEQAVELLGVRDPHVIHNGVDEGAFDPEPATPEVLRAMGVQGPFVLHAGGAARRKNLEGLAAAWPEVAAARPQLSLVLAGPDHPRRTQLFSHLPRVVMVGRVQQEVLRGLYGAASAVVVPSLVEGFGLPALEGMAAGVPVVVARTSSLPEVVGDGGLVVDPVPARIAEGIIDATSGSPDVADLALRGRRRAGQFTWARSALEHAKVWSSLR